jgi:glyoxylase-like metal-dependent hydrolase (beta-lactamase superfamily II)
MELTERVHVVGSDDLGFGLSHQLDRLVCAANGRTEIALIDAGVGLGLERIHNDMRADGFDLTKLKYVLLIHAHADRAVGCKQWIERFGIRVFISPEGAKFVRAGDESGISLTVAKGAGFYPQDYHFQSFPVDRELREGDMVRVGDCELRVTVIEAPGHCSGMLSLLSADGKTYLFSVRILHGGKILLINVYDRDWGEYERSVRKIAGPSVDALLPGHLCVVPGGGQGHIQKAADCPTAWLAWFCLPTSLECPWRCSALMDLRLHNARGGVRPNGPD